VLLSVTCAEDACSANQFSLHPCSTASTTGLRAVSIGIADWPADGADAKHTGSSGWRHAARRASGAVVVGLWMITAPLVTAVSSVKREQRDVLRRSVRVHIG
jgi:hypothetical protein